MGTEPVYSIIIATFNSAATLEGCLRSIIIQDCPSREIIVVDGGSRDGTLEIIRRFEGEIAHWESRPDSGVYQAWNRALPWCRGRWIVFLGSDDELADSHVLSDVLPHLEEVESQGIRFAYGKAEMTGVDGRFLRLQGRPWRLTRRELPQRLTFVHSGSFHHKTLFEEHGAFDESFVISGDADFILRELATRDAVFIDRKVAIIRAGGLSTLRTFPRVLRLVVENLRSRWRNGIVTFPWRMLVLLAKSAAFSAYAACFGLDAAERVAGLLTGALPPHTKQKGVSE